VSLDGCQQGCYAAIRREWCGEKAVPQCEWAPLMAAAIRGHRDTVELLLDSGADLEAKDRDGWTALMQVAAEGHKDTLVLLLDRGADPEAQNSDGCDSLALCKDGPCTEMLRRAEQLQRWHRRSRLAFWACAQVSRTTNEAARA